ncbi:MAG: hypothetical protein HY696_09210 [Deltaproteobacteria bacterium]|nr:hypothetical protein [Deltaproteobacteria bacterium]
MTLIKEELSGILTLSFEVNPASGILAPHTPVKLSAVDQIAPYVGPGQPDFTSCLGYVLIPNRLNNPRATVATKGRALITMTSGEPIQAGKPVTINSAGKVIVATYREPQSIFRVMDFAWNGGETVTVNGVVLTEGIDFVTGPDVITTAQNIANAIDIAVPGYGAFANAPDQVVVKRQDSGGPNFNNTIIPISTSDDGADILVALMQDGDISIFDPYGVALTEATAPDAPIDVLVR